MSYVMFRVASAVLGAMPEWAMRHLGTLAGRAAWQWADTRKHNARRAIARVRGESPDAPSPETDRIARELFGSYGRYWAEAFWIRPRRIAAIYERIEVEGIEHFRRALADGKGVVLALPHVGNWEVAGTVAHAEGAELLAVAEKLDDERIVNWFVDLRKALGIDIVLATGSAKVMETCVAAIGRNAAVALLADRNMSGRGAVVSFFGEDTRLPIGPARLALDTGAPILPVGSYFKERAGHRIAVLPPVAVTPSDDVASLTAKVAISLEQVIRAAPEQWHMVQPNWPSDRLKRRP